MQNFLVVSYDGGEQQWFYDTVRADSAEYAAALICKLRPYVQDAVDSQGRYPCGNLLLLPPGALRLAPARSGPDRAPGGPR